MNRTFIRDDNNMRVRSYLPDTQRFTPPPESDKLGEGL